MSDLKVIFPASTVELSSGAITVKPFTFGQLPKVLQKAQTIYGGIAHLMDNGADTAAVVQIMAVGGEDLLELVSLSIGKPREFFDTLQIDEGVLLVSTFLEVNLSFFVQRVLPEFKAAVTKLQAATGEK